MSIIARLVTSLVCLSSVAFFTSTASWAQPAADANVEKPAESASRLRYPQVNMAGLSREYRPILNHATKTDEKIRVALAAPCQIDVAETPLRDLITSLREDSGLPIVIDVVALNDAGHDPDTLTVTYRAPHDVSLRNALRQLLSPLGLTYIAADEVLTVTTPDECQNHPIIVSYPLPRGFGDSRLPDMQPMIDLIQSTVAASTWDCAGGMGTIRPLEASAFPLLVVSQTSDVHDEIETLLRGIHERLLAEFAEGKPVVRVHRVASAEARSSLAESLKDVCNDTLGEAGDPDATVKVVGDSVVVLSKSPEFHAVAGQVIAAVGGVPPPESRRQDPSAPDIAKPL